MDESEGAFDLDTWEKVHDEAKKACCNLQEGEMDEDRQTPSMQTFVERVIEAKIDQERGWKNG